MNRFIFGNLLYFNRTILCILTVRAVQLCKIQRDFLRICTLYVELCRYFCADVARRRGTRFVRSCWKRKKRRGEAPPRMGWEAAFFRQASTLLYIHTKNTPPGSVVLRAGWLGWLFTSDQTHKAGQAEGERRDIGDGQQGGNQCHKVGDQLGGHLLDGDMADATADKQDRADRRGDVAQAHIEDQHNAELNLGHAEADGDGQENRGEDQDGRGDVHEHANDQQNNIHQQEDDILVVGQAHQAVGDGGRDAGVRHDKRHGRGSGNQEQDDAARLGGVEQDTKEALEVDALIDDGEDQAVQNRDACALGGGKDTGDDAADDDDDEQQGRNCVPDGFQHALAAVKAGGLHAGLLCADERNDHAAQTHQDAGDVAGHEEGGDGHAARNGGVNDEGGGRGNQQTRGGRGDVRSGGVGRVVAVFLLNGADAAAHGGRSSNRGAGQRAEQHVAEDIGLCHRAGNLADKQLRKVDKALGDTAVVHDVAGQNKQRHSQQGE